MSRNLAYRLAVLMMAAVFLLAGAAGSARAEENPEEPAPEQTVQTETEDSDEDLFTIAWMSDTQGYCAAHPEIFDQMVEWIVENREEQHIRYVVLTGDIVNEPRNDRQWARAEHALLPLKGVLPFFAVAGNHDIAGVSREYKRFANLMETLGCSDWDTFGGMEENWRRRYDLVTIGDTDYIFMGAGYTFNRYDAEWMNSLLEQYPDRTAIILIHWYLNADGKPGDGDGTKLYKNVVSTHEQVKYVLCGHRHHVFHLEQAFDYDRDGETDNSVWVIMGDYGAVGDSWEGYINLVTFDPGRGEIRCSSYSPLKGYGDERPELGIDSYTLPLNTYTRTKE